MKLRVDHPAFRRLAPILVQAVVKAKPAAAKGKYVRSAHGLLISWLSSSSETTSPGHDERPKGTQGLCRLAAFRRTVFRLAHGAF